MVWELFRRDGADGPEMIGVDSDLLAEAPLEDLPMACEITIDAPATGPEFVEASEAALAVTSDRLGGRIAATRRTAARLWTLVHLPGDEHASRFAEIPLPAKSSLTVAPINDPDWTIFDRMRPVGMEEQSMHDLRIMADLHAEGDVGGVRRIDHLVSGLSGDRADEFDAAVQRLAFLTERRADGETVVRHQADPADLTADSWTIRLIAERLGATYRGWHCEPLRPDVPRGSRRSMGTTRSKPKWFGRR